VLVVSDLAFTNPGSTVVGPHSFLKTPYTDSILNIQTDYRYMRMGYYVSIQAEIMGCPVIPSSQNTLDAYRPPIFLLRASKRGLNTSPCVVTDNVKDIMFEVDFPLLIFPLHPASNGGYRVVNSEGSLYRAVRSLGMNQKYPVCAENLFGDLIIVKSLLGLTENRIASKIAQGVYDEFKIPICKLVLQVLEGEPFLCSLMSVHSDELTSEDLKILSARIGATEKDFD
jgi:hypothetical protein